MLILHFRSLKQVVFVGRDKKQKKKTTVDLTLVLSNTSTVMCPSPFLIRFFFGYSSNKTAPKTLLISHSSSTDPRTYKSATGLSWMSAYLQKVVHAYWYSASKTGSKNAARATAIGIRLTNKRSNSGRKVPNQFARHISLQPSICLCLVKHQFCI